MATVRDSITALYEQSQKSAAEGQAMFAVIESQAATPEEVDFEIPDGGARPPIARRFDDLRDLAEREMQEIVAPQTVSPLPGHRDDAMGDLTGADLEVPFAAPTTQQTAERQDTAPPEFGAPEFGAPEADPPLPNEPPAPATDDALSDLNVADIQELVRQAWEDETAIGRAAADAEPPMSESGGTPDTEGDDPSMAAAMQEIAAAVVQSGDTQTPADLTTLKAEIVAAMRAELHAVVAADLRPMIKTAIAEALQDMPPPKPAARAKKPATKPARKKAAARAKKAAAPPDSDN